jgi:hypothetical protein
MLRDGQPIGMLRLEPLGASQGLRLVTTTPMRIDGRVVVAESSTEVTVGPDGAVSRWTRRGPTCRVDDGGASPCAPSTMVVEHIGDTRRWRHAALDAPEDVHTGPIRGHTPWMWPWMSQTIRPGRHILEPFASHARPPDILEQPQVPSASARTTVRLGPQRWVHEGTELISAVLPFDVQVRPLGPSESLSIKAIDPVATLDGSVGPRGSNAPKDTVTGGQQDPRRARRIDVRADDGRVVRIDRPLPQEIPPEPLGSPPDPVIDWWVQPVAFGPEPDGDILRHLTALTHALRARIRPATFIGMPHAGATLRRGTGDCDDYAQLMVAALRHHGLHARVVHGTLVTDPAPHGRARHAWVEVWVGGAVGWLASDPAWGQPIADAARVADHRWGVAGPPRRFELTDAR